MAWYRMLYSSVTGNIPCHDVIYACHNVMVMYYCQICYCVTVMHLVSQCNSDCNDNLSDVLV